MWVSLIDRFTQLELSLARHHTVISTDRSGKFHITVPRVRENSQFH